MGCVGSEEESDHQKVCMQMTRLKHEIDSTITKIRGQAVKEEASLVTQFKKEKSFRAAAAENAIANSITQKINKIHVYEIVKNHLVKLLEYKHHLTSIENAKKSLFPSFQAILYSQSILKDQSISNFCSSIRKRFPEVKEAEDSQIDSEIMRHHKKSQIANPSMVNEYLLKLVNQENLDLAEINKVGHNIRFGV